MKNLRVSLKLSLGFGIITILLCILGYIGISSINSAQKGADTLESIYITELGIYNRFSADISKVGYNMVRFLASSDDELLNEVSLTVENVHDSMSELNALLASHPNDPQILHLSEFLEEFTPELAEYQAYIQHTYEARHHSLATWASASEKATQAVSAVDVYLESVMDGIGTAGEFGQQANVETLTALDINTMALVSLIGEFRMNLTEAFYAKDVTLANELIANLKESFAESVELQSTIPYANIENNAETMNASMEIFFDALDECIAAWERENVASITRATVYNNLLRLVDESSEALIISADETALTNIADLEESQSFFQAILIAMIVLTVITSILLTRQITSPIASCVTFAKEVARGNLSYVMKLNQRDEFGQLADALREIPKNLNAIVEEYSILSQKIATGHITSKGDSSKFMGEFASLMEGTNKITDSYLAIIENVPSAVVMLNSSQVVQYLNRAGRNACGDLFTDKTCKQIMNREDSGTSTDALALAIRTLKPQSGETIAHPQGGTINIKYFAVPMLDAKGNLLSIMQLILDVTDEKKLQQTIMTVAQNATEIAQRVASTATELSAQIGQAENAAVLSLSQVESTSVAMNEMNSTVLEVAHSASNASNVANDARSRADSGAAIVDSVVTSIAGVDKQAKQLKLDMAQLGEDAESINTIMNVISDIADQTNLLALNAAIEAARAGEAGRGFAVVADEVRKLAEKTMHATVEVGNAIKGVQSSVETNMQNVDYSVKNIAEATEQAQLAGSSLAEILTLVDTSADQVRSIAIAAEEQSSTSEEIKQNLSTVHDSANTMSVTMSEATQAVNDLAEQASKLNELIAQLQSTE